MALRRVQLEHLFGLPESLVNSAPEGAGRSQIKVHQVRPGFDIGGVQLDGPLELAPDVADQECAVNRVGLFCALP